MLDSLLQNDTVLQSSRALHRHARRDRAAFRNLPPYRFLVMPRLADLADQALYRFERVASYCDLDGVFKDAVDTALIRAVGRARPRCCFADGIDRRPQT